MASAAQHSPSPGLCSTDCGHQLAVNAASLTHAKTFPDVVLQVLSDPGLISAFPLYLLDVTLVCDDSDMPSDLKT